MNSTNNEYNTWQEEAFIESTHRFQMFRCSTMRKRKGDEEDGIMTLGKDIQPDGSCNALQKREIEPMRIGIALAFNKTRNISVHFA